MGAVATPLATGFDAIQKPLGEHVAGDAKFTLREQNEEICDAGSRQWTGWINVSDEKRLFFWFFESQSDPLNDPVAVWINGGPGGSSLMGLFQEIGPCLTDDEGTTTFRNEFSWTNFANVIFIDQPAGVGFSSIRNSTIGGVDNLAEVAEDFDTFLTTFFTDIFPQFSHLPFHITGESFAGTYIPGIVDYIGRRQQLGVPGVFQQRIQSIVLVDAVIDAVGSGSIGVYDHMCKFNQDGTNKLKYGFNETVCKELEVTIPECERLNNHCLHTYDMEICRAAVEFCSDNTEPLIEPRLGNVFPYDDRFLCEGGEPPLCGREGHFTEYLNSPKVQRALGTEGWNYSWINEDINDRWQASGDIFRPTTRELSWILDESPTRVLVLNGNNDIVVNTEGQKRVYDDLLWDHHASFRLEKYTDWFWTSSGTQEVSKGGEFKAVDKLAFVTLDEAGHTSPGDQKEATSIIMKCWLLAPEDPACAFLKKRTDTTHSTGYH
ncbi:Alpha/Beta hydrolase protein [Xylariales sp. PMI_506]|nr:Alpha/Beta hydrolase protein [Xylariales sp. PMI_506]